MSESLADLTTRGDFCFSLTQVKLNICCKVTLVTISAYCSDLASRGNNKHNSRSFRDNFSLIPGRKDIDFFVWTLKNSKECPDKKKRRASKEFSHIF